jgi:hypothetical protein
MFGYYGMRKYKTTGTTKFKNAPQRIKPVAFLIYHFPEVFFNNKELLEIRTLIKKTSLTSDDFYKTHVNGKRFKFVYLFITLGKSPYSGGFVSHINKDIRHGNNKKDLYRVF